MTDAQLLLPRRQDRGTIKVGQWADAVLFDPASVRERSTCVEPHAVAEGFDLVLVNGLVARENGQLQETEMHDGKVTSIARMTVSADGKTLARVETQKPGDREVTLIAMKQ